MYDKNKIVFIGNMRTLQNQDAVKYFVYSIFPLILQELQSAKFHIIGAEPTEEIKKMHNYKNIFISGFVSSIESEIQNAAVAVAPIRIAAGIQNKVLMAMACKVPVVLTSLIKSGIPELVSGNNCFIADEEKVFSQIVVSCMKDSVLRDSIGLAGYELVKKSYSWNKTLNGYEIF